MHVCSHAGVHVCMPLMNVSTVMYVCMYGCMYVRMYVCVCVCTYVCVHACMRVLCMYVW